MSHTSLLVQPTERLEGRTHTNHQSGSECMKGVGKIHEEHLKMSQQHPLHGFTQPLDFIDGLAGLSCLCLLSWYTDWIKEKIYVLLRRQAQQAGK
ncbi:enhancer of rudimentary homolog [Peromyscus californicus insignis]|uniref:enhancer of rudimentary homolog n=1 Tax=Peromyscus californicus insignis TaxID=564181 RepID=UPI0022A76312|nr:enhancer of rudimentary homolog [Peromyscus californicus insignis]